MTYQKFYNTAQDFRFYNPQAGQQTQGLFANSTDEYQTAQNVKFDLWSTGDVYCSNTCITLK